MTLVNSMLPRWAKIVASSVGGMLLILGTFVTRTEFTSLDMRLQTVQHTVEQILWRVGGPERRDLRFGKDQIIPCLWEDRMIPEARAYLDQLWQEAQDAAGKRVRKPRPRLCFADHAIVTIGPNGETGRLYGLYSPERNEALIAPGDKDIACVIIHEMLHAIVGPGHTKTFTKPLEAAGCKE